MVATLVACSPSADAGPEGAAVAAAAEAGALERVAHGADEAPWAVRTGVEQITVTGAETREPLTLYGRLGHRLLKLRADDEGQAHFAYLPAEYRDVQSGPGLDWTDLGDPAGAGVV